MTAPTYRATGTIQAVATGSVGGVLPGSMADGELVVFINGMYGGGSSEDPAPNWTAGNTPVAWTPVLSTGIKKRTNVGTDYACGAWLKEYVAADWTNPAVGFVTSDTQAKYGMLAVFNNPDPTDSPIEGANWSHGGASGLRTGPSVTTTRDECTIVQVFAIVDDDAVALDATDPGYTLNNQQGNPTSFDTRLVICTMDAPTAGTYPGAVLTDPGAGSDHWVCIGFALYGSDPLGTATGDLSGTDGADIAALAGNVIVSGTMAAVEGADYVPTGSPEAIRDENGDAILDENGDPIFDGIGGVGFSGEVDGDPPEEPGVATGTLAATEGADSAAFTGEGVVPLPDITGELAATEGADGASFTGPITATDTHDGVAIWDVGRSERARKKATAADVRSSIDRAFVETGLAPREEIAQAVLSDLQSEGLDASLSRIMMFMDKFEELRIAEEFARDEEEAAALLLAAL